MALGVKPISLINFKLNIIKTKISDEQQTNYLIEELKSIGLFCRLLNIENFPSRGSKYKTIVVSRSEVELTKFFNNFEFMNRQSIYEKKEYYQTGILLGYPETAVKAFVNKIEKLNKDLIKDKLPKIFNLFGCFVMSKDNWQEEIKILKKWDNAVTSEFKNKYIHFHQNQLKQYYLVQDKKNHILS